MGFNLTSDFQLKGDHPSENRVGGSRGVRQSRARKFAPQVVEAHQENSPTPTKTVSGIPYWLSRDPIAENGGINLYAYVYNNPLNYWDPDGLDAEGLQSLYEAMGNEGDLAEAVKERGDQTTRELGEAGLGALDAMSQVTPAGKACGTLGAVGKNAKHFNQHRKEIAKQALEMTRRVLDRLKRMTNKTPATKDAIKQMEKQTNKLKKVAENTGEQHSQRHKR